MRDQLTKDLPKQKWANAFNSETKTQVPWKQTLAIDWRGISQPASHIEPLSACKRNAIEWRFAGGPISGPILRVHWVVAKYVAKQLREILYLRPGKVWTPGGWVYSVISI